MRRKCIWCKKVKIVKYVQKTKIKGGCDTYFCSKDCLNAFLHVNVINDEVCVVCGRNVPRAEPSSWIQQSYPYSMVKVYCSKECCFKDLGIEEV